MKNKMALWLGSSLVILIMVAGCGTAATPTPAPTQAAQVITLVVVATSPPPTATIAPSITPLPTANVTETVGAASTPTPTVTKPVATKKPAVPAATATPSPIPMKFGAPVLITPLWNDNQKDEVIFPGGAIVFNWQAVGGLNGDECYQVQVMTEPVNPGPGVGTRSDYWVTSCGDQTAPGSSIKFTLESPKRAGPAPNYSSILLNTGQMWAHWSITVVKNLGQCDPAYKFHCKTAPISPAGQGYFLFKAS